MSNRMTKSYSVAERFLAEADPAMARLIEEFGPGLVRTMPHGFASMARIIAGQQLSTKAAASIYAKFSKLLNAKVTPAALGRVSDDALRSSGLSRAKVVSLRDLSAKVLTKQVSFRRIEKMTDEEVSVHLTQVKGIGPWSAQMYLMFVLGRPDIFAAGDLGIQTAVGRLYGKRQLKRLEKFAERWRPYRTVACWYLWRSLSNTPAVKES